MNPIVLSNIATGLGILVGVYSIVNRSEDRINKRMEDRFVAMEKLFTEKLLRVEQVMDARIRHLEER
jgi:hypothetical protein